jgi:hypothetical protein
MNSSTQTPHSGITITPGGNGALVNTAPIDLYVDPTSGNDTNPGTQALPIATLLEADRRIPTTLAFAATIHIRNDTYVLPDRGYFLRSRVLNAPLTVLADESWDSSVFQVISAGTAGAGTVAGSIAIAGAPAIDLYANETIEFLNGAAIGQRQRIRDNTTTEIIPNRLFSPAPAPGDAYRIIRPTPIVIMPATSPAAGSRYVFVQDMLCTPLLPSATVPESVLNALSLTGFQLTGTPAWAIVLFGTGTVRLNGIDAGNLSTALSCVDTNLGAGTDVASLWSGWGFRGSRVSLSQGAAFRGFYNGEIASSELSFSGPGCSSIFLGGRGNRILGPAGGDMSIGFGNIPFLIRTPPGPRSVSVGSFGECGNLINLALVQIEHTPGDEAADKIYVAGQNTVIIRDTCTGGALANSAVQALYGGQVVVVGVPVFGNATNWFVTGLPAFGNGDFGAVGNVQLSPVDAGAVTRTF